MTIGAWIAFIVFSIFIVGGTFVIFAACESSGGKFLALVVALALILGIFFGFRWYYSSTGRGQRALVDEKSNLAGGIERVINVYTADGDLIAHYEGKIDIDTNDGGYVKFDFDGNRYIYYNCFIETIAEIE